MKQVIRLTEGDLHNMVNECVNQVLNESNEHILYHNTEIFTLIKMIKEDKMFFGDVWGCQDKVRRGFTNYLSLTRYKGDYEGFQSYNLCSVRLTIDNDRFQSIMRQSTEPLEAFSPKRWGWGNKSAKAHYQDISKLAKEFNENGGDWDDEDMKEEFFGDYYSDGHIMFPEEFVQGEESMNTNKKYIDNPLRFILSIDIRNVDTSHKSIQELIKLLNEHPEWKRITYFHEGGLGIKD